MAHTRNPDFVFIRDSKQIAEFSDLEVLHVLLDELKSRTVYRNENRSPAASCNQHNELLYEIDENELLKLHHF